QHYTQSTFSFLTTLWRDTCFGARQLRRNPLLTFVGVASLALGVGANTAIFAGAKRVLFDTLPVAQPHELRLLTWVSGREQPVPPVWGDVGSNDHGGLTSNAFSYPVLQEMRKRVDAVQDFIAFKDVSMTATIDGHPEISAVEMISGNAFRALGVGPALGRLLLTSDDAGSGNPVAVISQGYWAERFGRSPSVLGKTILLNGVPITIVGVSAGRFAGLQMGAAEKIFVPLTMQPLLMPRAQNGSVSLLNNPQSWWLQILVRLRPDVPEARAQSELDATLRHAAMPVLSQTADTKQFHLKMEEGDRGLDYLRGTYAAPSYLLLALAGLILLLACVNLANLLLARSTSRQREMSTRIALAWREPSKYSPTGSDRERIAIEFGRRGWSFIRLSRPECNSKSVRESTGSGSGACEFRLDGRNVHYGDFSRSGIVVRFGASLAGRTIRGECGPERFRNRRRESPQTAAG